MAAAALRGRTQTKDGGLQPVVHHAGPRVVRSESATWVGATFLTTAAATFRASPCAQTDAAPCHITQANARRFEECAIICTPSCFDCCCSVFSRTAESVTHPPPLQVRRSPSASSSSRHARTMLSSPIR